MNIKLFFTLIVGALLLNSCFEYDDVEYKGFENVKMTNPKDGHMSLSFDLKLNNPNKFKIKIKPSDVTVFIGGKELGQVHLTETLTIAKRTHRTYPIALNVKLSDLFESGLGSAFEMMSKQKVSLRIKGFVRGSVYGITQKRYIDETQEMETAQFMKLLGV
jgi:LEA14-like dessication related protein